MTDLIFTDIETTGTEHWHRVWEIAAITVDGDSWHSAWVPSLHGASLEALRVNRLVDRYADGEVHNRAPSEQIDSFATWVRSKGTADDPPALAGAAIHFDLAHLQRFAGKASSSIDGGCHLRLDYHVVDVCTWAGGVFGFDLPASLRTAAEHAGVPYDSDRHHGAMYDAWLAREIYGSAHHERHGRWPTGWAEVSLADGGGLRVVV